MEHLPESEKHKQKSVNPLQDFLGAAQDHAASMPAIMEAPPIETNSAQKEASETTPRLTMEEYFTAPSDQDEYDGQYTYVLK